MAIKKWRPKRELVGFWTKWLNEHPPICHPQMLWDISQGEAKAKEYTDNFLILYWGNHKGFLQSCNIERKDFEIAFKEAVKTTKLLPYQSVTSKLLEKIHSELAHILAKKAAEPVFVPLDDIEKTDEGRVFTDLEDTKTNVEELRERGLKIREIADRTGYSKSTVQRMLKKK